MGILRQKILEGLTLPLRGSTAVLSWKMRTTDPTIDERWLRETVAHWVVMVFGAEGLRDDRIAMACLAIVNNESGGNKKHILGDLTAKTGPSIGLMQVSRGTAIDLKLWKPPDGATEAQAREAYAAMAENLELGIRWGVTVFRAKLIASKGNIAEAIRRYNGSGPAAEAYADRALEFLAAHGRAIV